MDKIQVIQPFRIDNPVSLKDEKDFMEHLSSIPKDGSEIRVTMPMYFHTESVSHILKLFRCKHCAQCCTQCNVRVVEEEIVKIANYLNVRTRKIRRMIGDDGLLRVPCPFLVNGRCRIYPVRPIVCYSYPVLPYSNPSPGEHLPIVAIVLCPGGKELAIKLFKALEIFREGLANNPDKAEKVEEEIAKRKDELSNRMLVLDPIEG